jgi:molecular chaperone GrpE
MNATHGSLGAGAPKEAPQPQETRPPGKKVSIVDRRRVGRSPGEIPETQADLKPTYVQELEERVKRAEQTLKDRIARLEEETQRSRQRLLHDLELRYEERERKLLLDVLGILDDLGRACALASAEPSVAQGLSLIAGRIHQFLSAHDCAPFSPEGQPFDPVTMEAVVLQEGREGMVTAVLQAGVLHKGGLLRPARVAVGRGEEDPQVRSAAGAPEGPDEG